MCLFGSGRLFLLGAFVIALFSAVPRAPGGQSPQEIWLRETIATNESNRLSVRTWTGHADVMWTSEIDGKSPWRRRYTIQFLYSREGDATRTVVTAHGPHTFVGPDGAVTTVNDDLVTQRLLCSGVLFTVRALPPLRQGDNAAIPGGRPERVVYASDPPGPGEDGTPQAVFFHPMAYYFEPGRDDPVAILRALEAPRKTSAWRERVLREGDVVTLELTNPRTTSRYVYDLAQGGGLVEYFAETLEAAGHSTRERIVITYQEHKSAFVPEMWRYRIEGQSGDRKAVIATREIVFKNSVVNEPLAPGEFSLDAMGILLGDRIMDERTGKSTWYSGRLDGLPVTRPTTAPATPPGTRATETGKSAKTGGIWREAAWMAALGLPLVLPILLDRKRATQLEISRFLAGWRAQVVYWAPRIVGIVFIVGAFAKVGKIAVIEEVLAFNGIPPVLIPSMAWMVLLGELFLGQSLIVGWGGRRLFLAAAAVLVIYCAQLAFLLASENPPECGCFLVQQLFATKHQGYTVGLIRNAVFIVGLCYAWRLARIGIKPVPGAESAG